MGDLTWRHDYFEVHVSPNPIIFALPNLTVTPNEGYILDFMWYTKGPKNSLVNLDISFTEKKGGLKT